jgi:hypothetical protein
MSTPKAKSTKCSTKTRTNINNGSWTDYRNVITGEIILMNRTSINSELPSILLKECKQKDFYSIEQFLIKIGIPERTYYRWLKDPDNTDLKDAHDYALLCAGVNRERLCIERNLSLGSTAGWLLPHLMKNTYGAHLNERNAMKEENKNQTQVVVIEKFPE